MSEDLTPEELLLLRQFRQTKGSHHAEGEWAHKDGKLVKLWVTNKTDIELELSRLRRLREVG